MQSTINDTCNEPLITKLCPSILFSSCPAELIKSCLCKLLAVLCVRSAVRVAKSQIKRGLTPSASMRCRNDRGTPVRTHTSCCSSPSIAPEIIAESLVQPSSSLQYTLLQNRPLRFQPAYLGAPLAFITPPPALLLPVIPVLFAGYASSRN